MNDLILGIDIGTTGCKSTVYNKNGKKLATGYKEYFLEYPKPKWVEINPDIWWEAVKETINSVLNKDINGDYIKTVGISCTNAIVPVDMNGQFLRNAIMQIDQRTNVEINWIKKNLGDKKIFSITGNRIAPGTFSAPAILWIKKNEPNIFEKTYKFLVPTGYIVQKLTNQFTIDPSRASTTMLFNIKEKKWSSELCNKMKISKEKLPEILESHEVAGTITKKAAQRTGLKEGIPVITGCMDTVAAALGSDVVESGDVFSILGTVGRLGLCHDTPNFDNRFINCCYGIPGHWLSMAAINGTGSSYRWFKKNFAQLEIAMEQQIELDSYELLNKQAKKSPAGAKGLMYLPYIAAERSPIWDSSVRAGFLGLNITHKREDFIRALLEGISYAFRHNLEIFEEELNIKFDDIKITGGGSKSKLWRQILADILGLNILLPDVKESETLGVAYLAGKGIGLFNNDNIIKISIEDTRTPDSENKDIYNRLYQIFKNLHVNLRDINNKLSSIQSNYY